MTAARCLRLGLVGFGRLAQVYYLPALRTSPVPLQLAVADPSPTSRTTARRLLPDAAGYPDHRALLERERPDAVLVASPPSTHLAVWRDAAALRLPVFMEKPFLLSHELALIDPADPAWSRLMVDLNRRFWPPYRQIAERLRAGDIGRPLAARFVLRVDLRPWRTVTDHRMQSEEGGALYDLGSQILDLAAMTLDELPQRLGIRRLAGSDDHSYRFDLEFPSGAVAECEIAYGDRNVESVELQGEHGTLRLDNPNGVVHRVHTRSRVAGLGRRGLDLAALGYRGVFRARSMLRYSVRAALTAFLHGVRHETRFSPGFDDALRIARWLATAEHTIRTSDTSARSAGQGGRR